MSAPAQTPAPPPSPSAARGWSWIPTLYFAQGLPNVAVATLSVVMYKNLGVSNADIALYTSWLYLPWVLKPLWSPFVELLGRKRAWIWVTQLVIGAAFAGVALTVPGPAFFQATLALFWLLAFSSATHDIAADGFYLLALPAHQQAAFVGVRSTCFRLAMIAGQGGLVALSGYAMTATGSSGKGWAVIFALLAAVFVVVAVLHRFVLPRPANDAAAPTMRGAEFWSGFAEVFVSFFRKPGVVAALAFLLLYRFAEAQLVKLVNPFLLDARAAGGLGLSNQQVGTAYGVVGVAALLAGGLLGGWSISRAGLKRMLWPMALAINVPNGVYVWLALAQPENFPAICAGLAVEQFGYGFGFAAYLLYMMRVAEGAHRTAHYAICTGFMALGQMLPGMVSGRIEQALGYPNFFVWVCIATAASFAVTALVKVEPEFGRKT